MTDVPPQADPTPGNQNPYAQPAYGQQPVYAQQPQSYGQQPYGQPTYPAAAYAPSAWQPAQPKGFSITSLVLGLVSLLMGFTLLMPIAAIVLGIIGAKKEPAGRGMSITGIVLGGVCLIGWVIGIVLFFVFIAAVASAAATYPGDYYTSGA
jgi:hypothetical protein